MGMKSENKIGFDKNEKREWNIKLAFKYYTYHWNYLREFAFNVLLIYFIISKDFIISRKSAQKNYSNYSKTFCLVGSRS